MPASSTEAPLVSCLMVTANRLTLCRRSVRCFLRQTWPNRELVVVDDGTQDLTPVLQDVPAEQLRYLRIEKEEGNVLGALRNRSLDAARGAFLAQWDDDDWYHPERLARQMEPLLGGADACTLDASLMHLNTPAFLLHPYVGTLKGGVPGSIIHRRDDALRYPAMRRAEDTVYLDAWRARQHVSLGADEAHLFIRAFHGSNTWEVAHFTRRIRNTPGALAAYVWHQHVRRDLFGHPRFRLSATAREAFGLYLEDSYELGLLPRQAA